MHKNGVADATSLEYVLGAVSLALAWVCAYPSAQFPGVTRGQCHISGTPLVSGRIYWGHLRILPIKWATRFHFFKILLCIYVYVCVCVTEKRFCKVHTKVLILITEQIRE